MFKFIILTNQELLKHKVSAAKVLKRNLSNYPQYIYITDHYEVLAFLTKNNREIN